MDHNPSSFTCELRIIHAKNLEIKQNGLLFVRCYLHAGKGSRVKLDSKEIPSKSNSITWNQTFSLDCSGSKESIEKLKKETLVFELRWRSTTAAPFMGKIRGSGLVGRAEISWVNFLESTNKEVEKWVVMNTEKRRVYDDIINIKLQIAVKLGACRRKRVGEERWDEGCGCNSCAAYEFFAIEAALEAL